MDFNWKEPTPMSGKEVLEKYTKNVTQAAKEGKIDPVIGRDEEILSVIRILSRKTKNNPVLIGEPGVGKTAIIEGLSQRIVKGDIPSNLKDKTILELDVGLVMAGAKYLGEYEERVKSIVNAIKDSNGEIILFIDELHLIVGAGKTSEGSGMDISNLLKPALARGEIKSIGATTLSEYKQYIEKDAALERRFQKIIVEEPSEIETISILRGLKEKFEAFHGVKIHDNALVAAVSLSTRYITDRFLPDKAIDLVDEACSTIKTELASTPQELDQLNRKITQLEIEKSALSKETDDKSKERLKLNIEELELIKSKQQVLSEKWNLEKSEQIKINSLRSTLDQLKTELDLVQNEGKFERAGELQYSLIPAIQKQLINAEQKINGRLISEEVNENEVAKIISKWTGIPISNLVAKEKEKLLSLENELQKLVKGQNEAISLVSDTIMRSGSGIRDPNKPIGSFLFLGPTGVGKTELAKSLSKILFDSDKKLIRFDMSEFSEKHSISKLIGSPPGYVGYNEGGKLTEIVRRNPYSILLFDEAEKAHPDIFNLFLQILDDGFVTDSSGKKVNFKNTIIIMTTNIASDILMNVDSNLVDKDLIMEELMKFFRPEFINRIDNIVTFNSLSEEVIYEIIDNGLSNLKERIFNEKDYLINFTDAVRKKINSESYDKQFGARPINRYIEKHIETLIAKKIVKEEIVTGKTYVVDVNENEFVLDDARKLN